MRPLSVSPMFQAAGLAGRPGIVTISPSRPPKPGPLPRVELAHGDRVPWASHAGRIVGQRKRVLATQTGSLPYPHAEKRSQSLMPFATAQHRLRRHTVRAIFVSLSKRGRTVHRDSEAWWGLASVFFRFRSDQLNSAVAPATVRKCGRSCGLWRPFVRPTARRHSALLRYRLETR